MFFKSIFLPAEIKVINKQIDNILDLEYADLLNQDLSIFVSKNKNELVRLISKESKPPNLVAWMCIFNVTTKLLKYGNCYVYRGVLSMEGQMYYALCLKAAIALKEGKVFTNEEYEENSVQMREIIATRG